MAGKLWYAKMFLLALVTLVWILLTLLDIHRERGPCRECVHPPLSVCRNYTFTNFTVVTALVDIGRGDWSSSQRRYNDYLLFMQYLLRMDISLLIFADNKALSTIERLRNYCTLKTHIIETTLRDLPYFRYVERFRQIMAAEDYRRGNKLAKNNNPEAVHPEYDVLTLSKAYMLDKATRLDPFNHTFFVWLDGGYGHGQHGIYPQDGVWMPRNLFQYAGKVTFIERSPGVESFRKDAHRLHKLSINIIAGGFTAGGKRSLQRLYALQQEVVAEWLERGIVDDEQSSYMLIYYREPELFHLVPGDWWDVFRLFR